jgi:peroxiredoxin
MIPASAPQLGHRDRISALMTYVADCSRLHAIYLLVVLAIVGLTSNSAFAAAPRLDGQEAPDFVLRTLEQSNLRLSEFRGQVVLINFWASWCGACRQAMPALNDIYKKYQRAGFVMLSINLDDESQRAVSMAQSLKIRYPVLLDDHKTVSRLYQVETMPLTVLIDREGRVRFVHVGYNAGDERKFVAPLRALLNE